MLILGSQEFRNEVTAELQRRGVAYDSVVLSAHSVEAGSVVAIEVAIGAATAAATTVLIGWLAKPRCKRRLFLILADSTGKRQQIVIENAEQADLPLLLAQAREVTLDKRQRPKPANARVKLPAVLRNALLDEVRSTCPSCGEHGVSKLEAHHIDGDRSRTIAANMLMLCANCHGQADKQLINREQVAQWKTILGQGYHPVLDAPKSKSSHAPVVNGDNYGQAAQTINNLYGNRKAPRSAPATGTIEADPYKRSYVHYLGKKYIAWRVKGQKEMGDNRPFNPKAGWNVIHGAIGFAPYKAGVESFPTVESVLKQMIDRTPFGSLNTSQSKRNYHTFEEHCAKMVRVKGVVKSAPGKSNTGLH